MIPAQGLPPVPHLVFGIFNLAIPDIIAWLLVLIIFFLSIWLRLPKFFEGDN